MATGKKTGGRQKGTPNKATADVKELAGRYSDKAMEMLAAIATEGESEAARVSACKEILDRAYGKAQQHVKHEGSGEGMIMDEVSEMELARRVVHLLTKAVDTNQIKPH